MDLNEILNLLNQIEWIWVNAEDRWHGGYECPCCREDKDDGHRPKCKLNKIKTELTRRSG